MGELWKDDHKSVEKMVYGDDNLNFLKLNAMMQPKSSPPHQFEHIEYVQINYHFQHIQN